MISRMPRSSLIALITFSSVAISAAISISWFVSYHQSSAKGGDRRCAHHDTTKELPVMTDIEFT